MLAGAASDDPETLGLMRGVPRVEGRWSTQGAEKREEIFAAASLIP